MNWDGQMCEAVRESIARMKSLPSTTIRQASDDPEDWQEKDRPLSPSELEILFALGDA